MESFGFINDHNALNKVLLTISVTNFHIPLTVPQCKERLREVFTSNKGLSDLRLIDMKVIKVISLMAYIDTMCI